MKRATLAADPQAPLPGMAPEPAKRYETVMVKEMPKPWECGCGKVSFAPRCWNCNAPKPKPAAVDVDGATAEGGGT